MTVCTNCDKEIENIKIKISLQVLADRKTSSGVWEHVSNLNLNVNELLCSDCFDTFSEALPTAMSSGKTNV